MDAGSSSEQHPWRASIARYIENECRPVDKFGHQPRLYALTREISAGLNFDDDVVYAAAWLHDLGVFYGHRPADPVDLAAWNNTAYAMKKAPEILLSAGFPPDKIPAVVEAIRTHQASAEPLTVEATILRDADILEQLGAIGILRVVCKVGRDTRYATFTSAVAVLRAAVIQLPPLIRLDRAKKIARNRVALLQNFLSSVDQDSYDSLF